MSSKNIKNKCDFWDCPYNQPVLKQRSARRNKNDPKPSGHCKIGRRMNEQVSGRCILGETKLRKLCPENPQG